MHDRNTGTPPLSCLGVETVRAPPQQAAERSRRINSSHPSGRQRVDVNIVSWGNSVSLYGIGVGEGVRWVITLTHAKWRWLLIGWRGNSISYDHRCLTTRHSFKLYSEGTGGPVVTGAAIRCTELGLLDTSESYDWIPVIYRAPSTKRS